MRKILSLFAAVLFAFVANAAVINITNETPDALRLALNGAASGDEIVMAAGTDVESPGGYIAFTGKDVTVKAAEGAEVLIQPQVAITVSEGGCAHFQNVKIDASRLIEINDWYEHLIYAADAANNSIVLDGCELYGFNQNASMLYCNGTNKLAAVTINNCYLHNIEKSVLFVENATDAMNVQVTNSTFANIIATNTSSYYAGIIDARATSSNLLVDHCTFYNVKPMNTDYSAVSKVTLANGAVSNCIFMLAAAEDGMRAMRGVAATNCITFNYLKDSGTGIHSSVTKTNCVQVDPLFVDAANADFTLGANSPALTMNDGQPIGDPRWAPAPTPIGAPAYYLVGTMNNWTEADAYKFVANPENDAEYMLSTTLAEGDSLKVIGIVGNTTTWYPDNAANYAVDAAHAGEKDIYFRPDGQGGDGWYNGVIYIEENAPEAPSVTLDYSAKGYENNTALDGVDVVESGVTFTLAKGTGSTAPAYYTTGTGARTYGGNTLTISGANYITKVEFTFTQNNKNYTVNEGEYSKESSTWTGNSASVVFTTDSGSGHNRIKAIKVTLGDPIPAPVEVHYYMKNNWNEGDWAWKEMTKDGETYKLDSVVFGGNGVNYNTAASDEGAVWVELAKIAGATIAAKDTVSFVLNPADSTVTATLIGKYVEPVVPVIASPYCKTEVGHFMAENADPNSFVLLSIGAKDGKTIVRIDQDAAKNNQKFDYLQVTGYAAAGADVEEGGVTAMAVAFDTPTPVNDSITLEILWSTVNWDGRWMVQNVKVPAAAVCESAELVHTYTVAGDLVDAFGTAWTPDLAANDMVKAEGDSLYRWEKAELLLAAGSSIAFKVCEDHAWTVAYPAENYVLNIAKAAIYTVKITFNPATKAVAAEAVKTGDAPLAEILFTEVITADQLPADTTFVLPNSEFKMQITDPDNKMSIDANACRFGVAKEYKMYSHRLKSGGKSSATKNFMTVTIPQEGTLRLAVRTGSNSATDRNLVVMQGEDTLLNQILLESQAIKVMEDTVEVSVYPYINVPVEAGSVVLSYPVNALNFYAFAFEPEPDHTYTVAGDSEAAFGAAWTPSREANDMVKAEGDSLYRWEKADITLAAGKIQFKVCEDHAWAHAWPAQNYELNIDKSGIYTIKITFDKKTKAVAAEAVLQQEIKVIPTIKMHGNFTGSWTNTALFELAADSLTASLKMNIAAGNYEFGMRIGGDGNWTSNGAQFTRENPSAKVVAGQGNLKLAADIAGEYTFTWFFDEDSLAIAYPKIIPHYNVAEAIAAELLENDEIFVRGVITKIEFKGKNFAKYGSANIYVADATGAEGAFEFYNCYSMNADTFRTSDPAYDATSESWKQFQSVTDGNGVEVAVGDTVEAFGKFKLYNTTYELNTGCYITNIKKPVIPADYYLVGTMNNWTPDSAYMFIVNPENDAEYMLAATLAPADELKVIGIAGKDTTWYPANAGNYVVDSLHAGEKVVYFRPDGQGGSDWYNGVIFIKENEEPMDSIPTTAPAAPTAAEDDVLAIYCNKYTTNNLNFGISGWAGPYQVLDLEGTNVGFWTDMTWECIIDPAHTDDAHDMSGYKKLHVDIWAPKAAKIKFTVEAVNGGNYKDGNLVDLAKGWNAFDFVVAEWPGNYDFKNVKCFVFEQYSIEHNPFGFANIYFYDKEAQGLENIDASTKAVKVLYNGQIYIIRNGKQYTITGALVK